MLGQDIAAAARATGHAVMAPASAELDVTDQAAVEAAVAESRPDALINCAAWTDVDGAESDEAAATAVNGTGAGYMATAAATAGAFVVQVSTDYVFDGRATAPYPEDHVPAPLSAYGRSKLAGEVAVANSAPGAHAIVRTAWLFGAGGRNFVDTMLRLGAERDEVTVVDDQVGCPTFTGHLAEALLTLAVQRSPGIHHVVAHGRCSWFELAQATFARAGLDCRVLPGRTADSDRPAPRPAFSVLGATRPDTPDLPPWQQGLDDYLAARLPVAGGMTA